MPPRVCIIGLHQNEFQQVRKRVFGPIVWHEMLPAIRVQGDKLWVARSSGVGMIEVDKVIYHGIYENDLDTLAGLAMWGGPCYPNPKAMMDCRLKLPCLVRALEHTAYPVA
ncbi:MAG: hypothetical protein AAF840_16095, partial [Bacteroidota bacterium]